MGPHPLPEPYICKVDDKFPPLFVRNRHTADPRLKQESSRTSALNGCIRVFIMTSWAPRGALHYRHQNGKGLLSQPRQGFEHGSSIFRSRTFASAPSAVDSMVHTTLGQEGAPHPNSCFVFGSNCQRAIFDPFYVPLLWHTHADRENRSIILSDFLANGAAK